MKDCEEKCGGGFAGLSACTQGAARRALSPTSTHACGITAQIHLPHSHSFSHFAVPSALHVQEDAAQLSIPNYWPALLQQQGGVGLNATTSQDETRYFVSLPSNKLELWFALESRRFQACGGACQGWGGVDGGGRVMSGSFSLGTVRALVCGMVWCVYWWLKRVEECEGRGSCWHGKVEGADNARW